VAQRSAVEPSECLSEGTVDAYVHGSLTGSAREAAETHAAGCAACRASIACLAEGLPREATVRLAAFGRPATDLAGRTKGATAGTQLPAFTRPVVDLADRVIGDKYHVIRRLGAGGMGVVFEAINTWTDRRVALKVLHPIYSEDDELVARFVREARSATRIEHPNIVDVLDLGMDPRDGALYMIQEFLTGPTLRQHMATHPRLTIAEISQIMMPLLGALSAAHRAGVVHRDVKPENVVLCAYANGGCVPKLIDFGISKILEGDSGALLQTGRALGTPAYMAPEQLRAEPSIDGRADVWATGVVLFELLAGRRPFDAATPGEVSVQILSTDAPPLSSIAPEVPPAVAAVVARALARDREARFATTDELLAAWSAAAAVHATPRRARPRRWPAYAAALLSAAALLLWAYRSMMRRGPSPSTVAAASSPTIVAPPRALAEAPAATVSPTPIVPPGARAGESSPLGASPTTSLAPSPAARHITSAAHPKHAAPATVRPASAPTAAPANPTPAADPAESVKRAPILDL